jgi:DNA-binding response OmpR family regulator
MDECELVHPERRCVLVVEDELVIGEIAAEALEEAGFAVLTAASAEEAEVILSRERVDVLFTDIDLGGRDGCILADRALCTWPGLTVVFASGRSRRFHAERIPAGAPFLAKPYRLADMIDAVDRAARRTSFQ